jgi:hypothetical protein
MAGPGLPLTSTPMRMCLASLDRRSVCCTWNTQNSVDGNADAHMLYVAKRLRITSYHNHLRLVATRFLFSLPITHLNEYGTGRT